MEIDSAFESGAPTTVAGAPNAFADLNSEEFVKIMFTELSNQDPLKPNDSAALLEQMSNLRSIQSDIELSQKLESLVTQNQLAAAGGLIGRSVSGLSEGSERVSGIVRSVSRTKDGPVLTLESGERVPFENVDEMVNAQTPPHAPDDDSDNDEADDASTPNPEGA